ncbi:4587_t:CDS:1, partial [Racocetra persica]
MLTECQQNVNRTDVAKSLFTDKIARNLFPEPIGQSCGTVQ